MHKLFSIYNSIPKDIVLLFVTFIPLLFVLSPFLHDGFFPTMDDVQVVRIEEMYKELISGQFPVRIASDLGNGAGYMLFNFYSPFVYYLGALFHFIGFTLVQATKLTFISGFMIAWLGIFLLLKQRFDAFSIFVGSVLFFSSSYVGYDALQRGALAEFFALSLLPFLFFSIIEFSKTQSLPYLLLTSFSIALLILTHNLTALITMPFIITLSFLLFRKNYLLISGSILLGLGLATFYWLPALAEKEFIIIDKVDFIVNTYKTHFLTVPQLIGIEKIPWGFLPPVLGINLFFGSLVALFIFLYKKIHDKLILFSLFGFFVSLFMASSLSKPIWELFAPVLSFVQFPWRFLTLATFFAVISCSFLVNSAKYTYLKILIGILLMIPCFTIYFHYLRPVGYNYISKYTADDPCGTAGWSNEYIPIWVKDCLPKGQNLKPVNIISGDVKIIESNIKNKRNMEFMTKGQGIILIDKYYFPGWQIKINDLDSTPISTPSGLITLKTTTGENKVTLSFTNTLVRNVANTISLVAIFISLLITSRILYQKRK